MLPSAAPVRQLTRHLAPLLCAALLSTLALGIPASRSAAADGLAYLVRDIATTPTPDSPSERSRSNIHGITVAGDQAYFTTADHRTGLEIWRTDGTAAGTALLKDINPGPNGSTGYVHQLTAVGDTLFFTANDGSGGDELWKSDGTEAGTALVKDIQPGPTGSFPESLVAIGETLYFVADDGTHGYELWKSDGTASGTVMVADSCQECNWWLKPSQLTSINGALMYMSNDQAHGAELWRSDGTAAGTFMVKDLTPGEFNTLFGVFVNLNGTLLFGTEQGLWRSDGTAAGTVQISFVKTRAMQVVAGRLFFGGGDTMEGSTLWSSDGTVAGTRPVFASGATLAEPTAFTAFNGAIYVSAGLSTSAALWRVTADGASATQIFNFAAINSYRPDTLTVIGGRLLFAAGPGQIDSELWSSDGTTAGTQLFKEIQPGAWGSFPRGFAALNGKLVFGAGDEAGGVNLWQTDGTLPNTRRVAEIDPPVATSTPQNLTDVAGRLFFTTLAASPRPRLWSTDGTAATTQPIAVGSLTYRSTVAALGSAAVFAVDQSPNYALWRSDGSIAGTAPISATASMAAPPIFMATIGGTLFFDRIVAREAVQLWRTDGTDSGSRLVKTIVLPPDPIASSPMDVAQFNALASGSTLVYFAVGNRYRSQQLWRSDGTADGTRLLADMETSDLTVVGDVLFYRACESAMGCGLWRSDGTTVTRVDAAGPGQVGSYPRNLTAFGDRLFFTTNDGTHGVELWRSDGTAAGTQLVADVAPGAVSSAPESLTVVGDTLWFSAWNSATGRELWRSDGTATGTRLVKDIAPGVRGSAPTALTNAGGTLVFAAADDVSGYELWASDGTGEHTWMVQDIAPGRANANPADMTISGARLFFSADDTQTGRELWALPLTALTPPQPPQPPQPPAISAPQSVGALGSCFPLTIANFAPQTTVALTLDNHAVGTLTTDANGGRRFTLCFHQSSAAGTYTLTASGADAPIKTSAQRTAQLTLTLDPAAPLLRNPGDAPVLADRVLRYLPQTHR